MPSLYYMRITSALANFFFPSSDRDACFADHLRDRTDLGRWQTTNMTVMAMEALVMRASRRLSTFSQLRRRFWIRKKKDVLQSISVDRESHNNEKLSRKTHVATLTYLVKPG